MKLSTKFFCLLSFLIFLISPVSLWADSAEEKAQEVYYEILSPFCPGRALADCPSEQAAALKQRIKSELESGKTKKEVSEEIFKEYGDNFRAVPSMRGWGSLAWLAPILIVVVGIGVVALKIRSSDSSESD